MTTQPEQSVKPITVIRHRFRDLGEALRAARFDRTGASLALPLPTPAPEITDAVSVRFRVGAGELHEAVGLAQVAGHYLIVSFEGPEAEVVKDAIHSRAYPLHIRAQPRYPCCTPVTLLARGRVVQAIACDVGMGGARLMALSASLRPGESVKVRFGGDIFPAARARVVWAIADSPGGAAGLAFAEDPSTLSVVRQIVAAAAGAQLNRKAS